jgi:DNA polymerase-3 subunit delta
VKPVFLLIGDEGFLKEEWLRDARAKIFKNNAANTAADYNLFFANEAIEPAEVLDIARTRPFLSEKRLIVIKNIDSLKSDTHRQQVLEYLKAPSDHTMLVLEADLNQRDYQADKFLQAASEFSQVVPFKKLYDANLSGWIARRAILKNKKIEPAACELLKQFKGNNLKAIDEEIEKLSVYVGERPVIAYSDTQVLVGKDKEDTVYELMEAMSRKDTAAVLSIGADFDKNDLGGAAGLLCWNLRLLLRVKTGEMPALRKFQVDRALLQAKRFSASWLKKAVSELTEFDLQIKTSALSDTIAGWQMLLVRLLALL